MWTPLDAHMTEPISSFVWTWTRRRVRRCALCWLTFFSRLASTMRSWSAVGLSCLSCGSWGLSWSWSGGGGARHCSAAWRNARRSRTLRPASRSGPSAEQVCSWWAASRATSCRHSCAASCWAAAGAGSCGTVSAAAGSSAAGSRLCENGRTCRASTDTEGTTVGGCSKIQQTACHTYHTMSY